MYMYTIIRLVIVVYNYKCCLLFDSPKLQREHYYYYTQQ